LLIPFWENHDPTQGMRQGNDVGSQYRSAIYWTTPGQELEVSHSEKLYQAELNNLKVGTITTEIASAEKAGPFYYAEDYHQQYLAKNPHGYRCHAKTGVAFPVPA
jgi:peptide-methionine (S)-S-oxide reductase